MAYILVINPGSTSTKIAIFNDACLVFEKKVYHSLEKILSYPDIISQLDFRKDGIIEIINDNGFNLKDLHAVCGRGGMLKPIKSGTYLINQSMVEDLKKARYGEHASNLGSLIAFEIALDLNIPAYTVDPVSVDEMESIARISGMPLIIRQSFFHALNHKAVAKTVAKRFNKNYEDMNLIIAHLGGGISIAAHHYGRVVDVNESLEGDGPMTPERSGDVPLGQLYKMCFSGKYTINEIRRMNHGQGGLAAYLGTNNADEIVRRINNGDEYAKLIYDAMIYQIAKEIGAYATVLYGEVDFIVLTGGLAYDDYLVNNLIKRIIFIAEVLRYPGENEMLSLANGALQVITNHEKALIY